MCVVCEFIRWATDATLLVVEASREQCVQQPVITLTLLLFEQALGMLFWHKYDVSKATEDLSNFVPFPSDSAMTFSHVTTQDLVSSNAFLCLGDFTLEDRVLFEQGYHSHGKSFHRIKEMVLSNMKRTHRMCIAGVCLPLRCLTSRWEVLSSSTTLGRKGNMGLAKSSAT